VSETGKEAALSRIARIVALAFGLAGAAIASQGPEFAQQYRQRLGGAIDELRRVVEQFDSDARETGESREGAIARMRGNPDDLAGRQGVAMQGNVDRLQRLEAHRHTMEEAGPFARVALMVRDGDTDIMRAAYGAFEPALPITEEGLACGAIGFFAVWGAILLLWGFLRSLLRRPGRRLPSRGPLRA
jgi:hypothetical protein